MAKPNPKIPAPGKLPPWRPTKLTPEVSAKILEAIGAGNTLPTASEYAGLYRETLRAWMDRGEKEADAGEETVFSRLFRLIRQKMAETVARNVALIQKAGGNPQTWTAAAWWLERRHPEDWGKPPERLEVSTPLPLQFVFQLPDGSERPLTVGKPPPSLPP